MNPNAKYVFNHFSGINNTDDHVRISPAYHRSDAIGETAYYPLVSAVNIDIDNSYALSSRDGSQLKLSCSNAHSLWSNNKICFFVDGSTLSMLNSDYTATVITNVTSAERMSYVQVNDRIYMTNGSYIGYYDSSQHVIADPNMRYKMPLPAGQRIAYFKGRLLIAKGRMLYIADALCDHYDIRSGFAVFETPITMVRPVDDGIYISDDKTWFLSFAGEGSEYKKAFASDAATIPFTDIVVDGRLIGEGSPGIVAMWVSGDGVCVGDGKGVVKNVTPAYIPQSGVIGAGVVRTVGANTHYIATLN
jgi:hypothetical protein